MYLSQLTRRIGLAPTLHVTTTEPFHLATQLASLDHASHGRAAWVVGAANDGPARATIGATPLDDATRRQEVRDAIDVARALWDSWEDGAVIKDVTTLGSTLWTCGLWTCGQQPAVRFAGPAADLTEFLARLAGQVDGVLFCPAETAVDFPVLTDDVLPALTASGLARGQPRMTQPSGTYSAWPVRVTASPTRHQPRKNASNRTAQQPRPTSTVWRGLAGQGGPADAFWSPGGPVRSALGGRGPRQASVAR